MTHLLRTYDRGVLRVTINRPGKRNALLREALRELRVVFAALAARLGASWEALRASEQEHFVRTWTDAAHRAATEAWTTRRS